MKSDRFFKKWKCFLLFVWFINYIVVFNHLLASPRVLPDTLGLPLDMRLTEAEKIKIDSILKVLTLEEKVKMLHGSGLFTSGGLQRLGLRELTYTDGPSGIREEVGRKSWEPLKWTNDSATFFPTGSALAATWNPILALKYGIAIGEEARSRRKDILLGPAVNITRTPVNGRTYEYLSEDPLLNAKLAVNYISGVQSTGVIACVKHYAANNQETNRGKINVEMDERALREIYLPAFKASIEEAHAYAIMSAYNKFRGVYCGENKYLLTDILRNEWGFDGIVVSDWGGTHSTVASALNGLDVEMGSDEPDIYFGKSLIDSVTKGIIPVNVIDDKVRRILKVLFFAIKKDSAKADAPLSTPEHIKTAYDIASQSIVLLKNNHNTLPLNPRTIKSIAVIGENAIRHQAFGGFGAGVKARYEVTPLEALRIKFGNQSNIRYTQGYFCSYEKMQGKSKVKIPKYEVNDSMIHEAVKIAASSDIAIVFAGTNREVESESYDRVSLNLPFGQDRLINAVTKANPRTIVVVVAAAPVNLSSCLNDAPAVVWSWFNGSEGGNALVDVLTGKINPSGKMPFTFPQKLEDSPAHALHTFPGENETAHYSEGILVGYRWFDTRQIQPQLCFGYGLSYTTFKYSSLSINKPNYVTDDTLVISFKLKNTGKMAGFETVQAYISDISGTIPKAQKDLKAFQKVYLEAGKEVAISLKIRISDLAYFDVKTMQWVVNRAKYKLLIGASSRDIRLTNEFEVR